MKYKYKTVDTSTTKGMDEAAQLYEDDWTMGSVGFYTIQFYKAKETKK